MLRLLKRTRKFGLLISSAIVVLGTFFGLVLIIQLRDHLVRNTVQQVGKQEALFAQELADVLKQRIGNLAERLTLLTYIPQLRSLDAVACNQKLKEVFTVMESKVDNLSRVDAKGVYFCAIDPTRIGLRAAQAGDFMQQIFDDPAHQAVLSRAIRLPGNDKLIVSLHVPVYEENGVFAGTLGGSVTIEGFPEKYLQGLAFVERGYVVIMDDNGDVLYHPEEQYLGKNYWTAEVFRPLRTKALDDMVLAGQTGRSGVGTYQRFGEVRLAAYAVANVFPGRRWLVFITVPAAQIEAVLDQSGFNTTFLWIGLIVGMVLFSIPVFVFSYMVLPSLDERRRAHELVDSEGLFEIEKIKLEAEIRQLKEKLEKPSSK